MAKIGNYSVIVSDWQRKKLLSGALFGATKIGKRNVSFYELGDGFIYWSFNIKIAGAALTCAEDLLKWYYIANGTNHTRLP